MVRKNGLLNASLLLLLASVFGLVFSAAAATSSNSFQMIKASTDEGGSGGSDDSGGGSEDSEPEPEPDPEPEPEPEPDPEPEPKPEPLPAPGPGDKVPVDPPVTDPLLPPCDGSAQRCVTDDGNICELGQGSHECECEEDMSNCPFHPSIIDPPIEPPKKPLPYCDLVPDDYEGSCHDRRDYDDITKKYPCNDGTQADRWQDCEDASGFPYPPGPGPSPSPKPPVCQALGCPGSPPDPEKGCNDGRDPVNGFCPYPKPKPKPCDPTTDPNCEQPPVVCIPENPEPCQPKCKKGYELHEGKCVEKDDDDDEEHKTIIRNINIYKTIHNTADFPEIDIIGLSLKDTGEAMVCAMNIDNDWVQCQEFGVPEDRINEDVWRIIETDQSKDYDNGNTGSEDVDNTIGAIKSGDFAELDDLDNHEFDIDLAAVGINSVGDGLVCLINDPEGTALCEPFKVSNEAITGQITEITEIES
jgi:hypothetical protein